MKVWWATIDVLRCCALLLPLSLLLAPLAFAQDYRVDTAGGPLTLPEEVADAAAAWQEAAPGTSFTEVDDAADSIEFGDPQLMGPDLVSATVAPESGGLEVRLNPETYRDFPAALVHELGLLLGVPGGGAGVMSPLLTGAGPGEPTEEDLAALEQVRERVTGDLDGDGEVGLDDLAELGRAYGNRGVNLAADLDGDGVVGAGDLEILREVYEFAPPAGAAPAAPAEQAEEPSQAPTEAQDAEAASGAGSGQDETEQDGETAPEDEDEPDQDDETDDDNEPAVGNEPDQVNETDDEGQGQDEDAQ